MSGNKRRPDRELNHENWDDEEEPVEAGVFQQASVEQISQRKILKANRRLNVKSLLIILVSRQGVGRGN